MKEGGSSRFTTSPDFFPLARLLVSWSRKQPKLASLLQRRAGTVFSVASIVPSTAPNSHTHSPSREQASRQAFLPRFYCSLSTYL